MVSAAARALCRAARPTASRPRALAASGEVRSPNAKSTVTKPASCDEPFGPFSEAAFVSALLFFIGRDIQAAVLVSTQTRVISDAATTFFETALREGRVARFRSAAGNAWSVLILV